MNALLDLPETLIPVQEFLADRIIEVERRFDAQLACELPPVSDLCAHIERYRGKMLRPTLVLLCGLATAKNPDELDLTPDHITLAAVTEMVHMATLVHDDVLDGADTRRRGLTVNKLRGNEAAVILGDYLIASSFHLCSQTGTCDASLIVGRASMAMCAGELLQLHNRENFSIDEPTYEEIVRRKTGALIGAACRLGALASGANSELCDDLESFGVSLGAAFQIQDDLLDLTGRERVVGKSVGQDAKTGKLTLPVIHHLVQASTKQRSATMDLLVRLAHAWTAPDAEELATALEATGSIDHARDQARSRVDQARARLTRLPDSNARQLLELLAQAVVDRAF
jgi:octaprenyl-diphosphate synthase